MSKKASAFFMAVLTAVMTVSVPAAEVVDTGLLMLINAEHKVDEEFNPERVRVEDTYFYMREEAAKSLYEMLNIMERELGEAPMIISTYRSYEKQEDVFNTDINKALRSGKTREEALEQTSKYIQIPGGSEHQSALAVDLSNDGSLEENFIETKAGVWLNENSHKYGFIIRYPDGKEEYTKINYEPWHIRYVGHPYSDIIHEKGWCLEEFIEYMKRSPKMVWEDARDVWYIYFVREMPKAVDENTTVSDTNSEGYIVTTREAKNSIIVIDKSRNNVVNVLNGRIINRITADK